MRSTCTRRIQRMNVFSILMAVFVLANLAFAQTTAPSKRALSQTALPTEMFLSTAPSYLAAGSSTLLPPATTNTWTGSGGNTLWSNAGNWSAGAITSGENIAITKASSATTDDQSFTIGTLTLAGGDSVTVNPSVSLTVGGNIANNGTITLGTTATGSSLVIGANLTLSGSGNVTMSNNANNNIFGSASLNQLTNQETIQGAGRISGLTLVNSGIINSNASSGLTIQTNGFTNTGTVEATGGNVLFLQSTGTINNAGGTILANASTVQVNNSTIQGGNVTVTGAGTLQLNNGAITLGTITNSATGTIAVASGFSNFLGGTINNSAGGVLSIANSSGLLLDAGTYTQLGKVQLNSSGGTTELVFNGSVTLSGGSV